MCVKLIELLLLLIVMSLIVLLLVLVVLEYTSSDNNEYCDRSLLSVANAISYCHDGHIGIGNQCQCSSGSGSGNCELAYMRSFLPSSSSYLLEYRNERMTVCDRLLSHEFGRLLLNTSIITKGQGYPVNKVCGLELPYDVNCHTPSIGKYIRYQSLMQYHRFKGLLNDNDKNDFIDIDFPHGWIWSVGDTCNSVNLSGRWSCIFRSITESVSSLERVHKVSHINLASWYNTSLIVLKDMFNIKYNNDNSVVHIMMYGKIMEMMSKPSSVVEEYIEHHLTNNNQHLHDKEYPSVSMHVRQGDACDNIINDVDIKITKVNINNNIRNCYSIDAYMLKLHQLKDMYGVKRVYLATDSQDMIYRTITENEFNWIYINTTRDSFNSHLYIDNRMRFDQSFREVALFSAVADLELMKRGDIFLGAFSSHYSKLAYFLMSGSKMRPIPFISLDHTLACDQLDTCDDENISRRPHTVSDIINWAPECIHDILPWSPTGNEDPCGIY